MTEATTGGGTLAEQLLDTTNSFYSATMSLMDTQKKLQGITVEVERNTDRDKYKKVFGSVYTSNLVDDDSVEHFQYVVLIQVNDMKNAYMKNVGSVDFYDNADVIQKGDLLSYTRGGQRFQFKVVAVETFSDVGGVLYHYTLQGLWETNTTNIETRWQNNQ
jgi:hypothetical protein